MSKLIVNIVDKETIKPSSPTPPHLKSLTLSLIDQYEPPVATSIIVFFSASTSIKLDEITDRLRKSLPDTLTRFYPLAGRISNNQFIDCNDQGINLFESRVNAKLARVVRDPIAEEFALFLPDDNFGGSGPNVLLSIQMNVFECGGMALAFRLSHKVGDGSSLVFFINTWAASTKAGDSGGSAEILKFGTASLFPPKKQEDIPPVALPPFFTEVKRASKRIFFSDSDIAALRAKCSGKSYIPTRVEAVTAFIWSCIMKAANSDSAALMAALNLRRRMDPPLSTFLFGNLNLALFVTSTTTNGTAQSLDSLVGELHRKISKVDGGYIRKLQANDGVLALYDSYRHKSNELSLKGGENYSIITSCCGFGMYEADFGWGKPEWATFADFRCENLTFLQDTRCGFGIEAWVTLSADHMSRFECSLKTVNLNLLCKL